MSFEQVHGSWNIYTHRQTLVIHTAGAWNGKAMKQFCDECKQIAQPLIETANPWSSLVLLDDYELGVPEIEPLLKALLEWLTERGLTREAAVFNGGFARTEQMARNLPQHKSNYYRQNFAAVAPAVDWLEQQGFSLDVEVINEAYEQWRLRV